VQLGEITFQHHLSTAQLLIVLRWRYETQNERMLRNTQGLFIDYFRTNPEYQKEIKVTSNPCQFTRAILAP
jgi:hypothetical protein